MRAVLLIICVLVTSCCVFAQQDDNKTKKKQETKAALQHLKLYPAQATTYTNVYVDFDQPTNFTITILGSPLNDERKWELKAKTTYQQKLDVTQLPDGTYTIMLVGGGIQEKAQFSIKR